jgi:hypothetical protein
MHFLLGYLTILLLALTGVQASVAISFDTRVPDLLETRSPIDPDIPKGPPRFPKRKVTPSVAATPAQNKLYRGTVLH